MNTNGDMWLSGEDFEADLIATLTEDGSGSDNLEPVSGDDQALADENGQSAKKKKFHRHTASQIQELESWFKECPYPDKTQRAELSRTLGIEGKQIKFWFQNKRAQTKVRLEHNENKMLKQEKKKLRAEKELLKQALAAPICKICGDRAVPCDISSDLHQLKIENARLREERRWLYSLTNQVLGEPSSVNPVPPPPPPHPQGMNSNLEVDVGRNGFGGTVMGFNFGDGVMMPGSGGARKI